MKTRKILLPTVAMLALLGCERNEELAPDSRVRNSYNSLEDCKRDWNANSSSDDCQYDRQHHHYVGPWYPYHIYQSRFYGRPGYTGTGLHVAPKASSGRAGSSFFSRSALTSGGGKVSISRGGFGSIGHGFSAHGG